MCTKGNQWTFISKIALFKSVFDVFVNDNCDVNENIKSKVNKLLTDLKVETTSDIKTNHFEIMNILENGNVLPKLAKPMKIQRLRLYFSALHG